MSQTIAASAAPDPTVSFATLGFTLKRRGPAAPGLTTSRDPTRWISALCVWPYTMTSAR